MRTLTRELDDKLRDGRRGARDVFRKKPRELARRLREAIERDVTPVAVTPLTRAEEFAVT